MQQQLDPAMMQRITELLAAQQGGQGPMMNTATQPPMPPMPPGMAGPGPQDLAGAPPMGGPGAIDPRMFTMPGPMR